MAADAEANLVDESITRGGSTLGRGTDLYSPSPEWSLRYCVEIRREGDRWNDLQHSPIT